MNLKKYAVEHADKDIIVNGGGSKKNRWNFDFFFTAALLTLLMDILNGAKLS